MTSHTNKRTTKNILQSVATLMVVVTLFAHAGTAQAFSLKMPSFFWSYVQAADAGDETISAFPVAEKRTPRFTQTVRLSFYTSNVNETDDSPCIPADGSNLCIMAENGQVDGLAANFLRLGTLVTFPELSIDGITFPEKTFKVRDRMNARYNGTNYVDMYVAVLDENGKMDPVASKKKAKELGVRYVTMEVF